MAYQWNQTVYDTSDNMYTNPDFSNKKTLNFQMQICRNITKPIHPEACNVSAATYMVSFLCINLDVAASKYSFQFAHIWFLTNILV